MRFLLIKMSGVESKLQKEIMLCTIIPETVYGYKVKICHKQWQMDYIVTLEKEVKIICSHLVRSSY